jgi:transposase
MALGRAGGERQVELWIATDQIARGPGHVFYDRLNQLLKEAGFDRFVEGLCEKFYKQGGRPGVPPGVYFRMLLVGYFEGITSQRGIAWRCGDSLSLRSFLGVPLTEDVPDHSSLTRIRDRLPPEVTEQVFAWVLGLVQRHGLLSGKSVGIDSTMLEADAAMKSIVRKDSGEDWKAYLRRLMIEEGAIGEHDEPTDEELRRFDKQRAKSGTKKVSNEEWESPTDPDARIVRMKDGRTHLGYKAEHVVDLETEVILSAQVHHGTEGDSQTLMQGVVDAQRNLLNAGSTAEIQEVAADKGYHANDAITHCTRRGVRTYIPEPQSRHDRVWADKPEEVERAVVNNRRRMQRDKGRRLGRLRSEKVERSFAHLCDTGGGRRSWLCGLEKINKRYAIHAAAYNLAVLMRKAFGLGKPRGLAAACAALLALLRDYVTAWTAWIPSILSHPSRQRLFIPQTSHRTYSTGC